MPSQDMTQRAFSGAVALALSLTPIAGAPLLASCGGSESSSGSGSSGSGSSGSSGSESGSSDWDEGGSSSSGGGSSTGSQSAASGGSSAGASSSGGSQASGAPVDPNDLEAEPPTGSSTPASNPATAQAAATDTPATPAESPWGRPEGDTGEALPERRPLSGSARDSYRRGLQLAASGDSAGARREFQAALSADQNAYRAAYNLGVMADRAGDTDQALQFYRQALRIQPDYELALEGVVAIYVRQGRAADAVAFVEPVARRWVRNLDVQAVYGDALISANRARDAVTAARAALRRDERFVPAMVVLVKANLQLGLTEQARSILEQAAAIDDTNPTVHFLRGNDNLEQGQLAPALQEFRRAVELRPDYADARMSLGLLLLQGGNYDEAVQQFEAAARLAPERLAVHLGLGDAYRSIKQWQKAKAEFDRVVAASPNNADVHFNLALMYMAAGADFPGMDELTSLQRAQQEFQQYRSLMGPRLPRDDQSTTYLEEVGRSIDRTKRALEREAARQAREAARAAKQQAPAEGETQ